MEAESYLVRGGNFVVQSCAVGEQIEVVRGGGASRQGEFGERGLRRNEDVFGEQARKFYDLERLWRAAATLVIPQEAETRGKKLSKRVG